VVSDVQLLIATRSGAMKSLISVEKESDERLLRYAALKLLQVPGVKRALNEIAASPNVMGSSGPKPPCP